ncbi:ArnT family glycosyltransferase [Kingella negevensis]|uniref:ArnT family glycosyltransferase n=1 Tax=Kingella negevensis TaxID=1522312 RepID=UPI00050A0539|nr:membrane protein [Kingella negevensis]MDK4689478.1 glycosyltransferase family 39 protein [Kingella negevensis]
MLTYTPNTPQSAPKTRENVWLLLLLVFVWLWPGVFSHDLWKPSEPKIYTVIEEAARGTFWLSTFNGNPYFDISPLYVQLAVFWQKLLHPWAADAYSSARFASVTFTTIGLLGSGMAGYRFLGRHFGRNVILILIGSAGLLPIAHFVGEKSPIFAGVGLALWGYSIANKQVLMASLIAGLGIMLLAQSAGIIMAAAVLFSGCLLWLHPVWHNNRLLTSLSSIAAVALPLCAIYPIALNLTQHNAFQLYMQTHIFGSFGGTHTFQAAFSLPYYLKHVLWFAFPALPLAAWTVSRGKWLQTRAGAFAATWCAVYSVLLTLTPERNQDLLVFLLPPFALLGAAQLDNLRRGVAAFLNWFGAMLFGMAAVFLWIGFVAMNYGFPVKLAERAAYFSPYYTRDINTMPMIVAIVFTPMWFIAITRRHIRGRQAVTNWAAGMTLVWALLMTLFLPWIDAAKSYRPIVAQMQSSLPENVQQDLQTGKTCLFTQPENLDARIAWKQYSTLPINVKNSGCQYELVTYNPQAEATPTQGKIIWEGRRPRNKQERFVLLERF